MRVGIGFDAHRFEGGRRLVLGGVEVPFDEGLAGHSDADVVLHALMDAMLGACGAPDIGSLFPEGDPAYRDASSLELLRRVVSVLHERGYSLGNADVTVICEAPRISGYSDIMCATIAGTCGVEKGALSVKGKTTEGMGFTGQRKGIAAIAVALMEPL